MDGSARSSLTQGAAPGAQTGRRTRPGGLLAMALSFAALTIPLTFILLGFFSNRYLDETARSAQNTLRLAVSALQGQLDRYQSLPKLLAAQLDFRALARDPQNIARIAAMNRALADINAQLEASDIYILSPDGTTIAASNFDQPRPFVGENFAYRPYYTEAIAGGEGRFFALGTTSLKRGYYFSAPIRLDDRIAGVVVIKVDLDPIETTWLGRDPQIMVTDAEGIIFMSGRPEWLFSAVNDLTRERLARTSATRRYADATLRALPLTRSETRGGQLLFTIAEDGARRDYLVVSEQMADADWTVQVLADPTPARLQARITVALVVVALWLAVMGALLWRQRRARLAERLAHQREVREQLERRVEARTRDLADLNARLKDEIAERRATEAELRKTQSGLVQTGKLAALGQMSAALSHEFNQPLAALRSYADSANVLIERGRTDEGRQYISRIGGLVERMSAISRHLSNFARSPGEKLDAVSVSKAVADALAIVDWRIRAEAVEIALDLGSKPLIVRAGQVRLQQVLVNILSNALDAMEGSAAPRIEITASRSGSRALLIVRDVGPGVPAGVIDRVFDPFFSTKGVGRGLGLGLSISYNIIKDFGGDLTVRNAQGGGAVFQISLDLAEPGVRQGSAA
ncbi:MAG: ATP-binding protein [Paracoccus sp. (in: a-proteobacteria)]|nr:ATP-binding protein [Paracoccus sp. (in: a-proteobacteria)]